MYGEKAEEAEELKLDLLDVKAMYRSQVIDYCTNSACGLSLEIMVNEGNQSFKVPYRIHSSLNITSRICNDV